MSPKLSLNNLHIVSEDKADILTTHPDKAEVIEDKVKQLIERHFAARKLVNPSSTLGKQKTESVKERQFVLNGQITKFMHARGKSLNK